MGATPGRAGRDRLARAGRRRRPGPRTRRLALGVLVAAVAAGVVWASSGPRRGAPGADGGRSGGPAARLRPMPLLVGIRVRSLGALLPVPLSGLAAAALGGRVYLFGGAGPNGFSAVVYAFTPPGGRGGPRVRPVAALPAPLHDGAAAAGGGAIYFCGGGTVVGGRAVYRFAPSTGLAAAGLLPVGLSDLGGATLGGRPVCLGGWSGTAYSDAVWAVGGPAGPRLVARLAHAVRYAAVSPLAGGLLVAGGRPEGAGAATWLQWVPPPGRAPARVAPARLVGSLPAALVQAMGAPLDGEALVIGGCSAAGRPRATVWAVRRPGASPRAVGRLPQGLCDGAAAALGGRVYVFGGLGPDGVSDAVWQVSPVWGPRARAGSLPRADRAAAARRRAARAGGPGGVARGRARW